MKSGREWHSGSRCKKQSLPGWQRGAHRSEYDRKSRSHAWRAVRDDTRGGGGRGAAPPHAQLLNRRPNLLAPPPSWPRRSASPLPGPSRKRFLACRGGEEREQGRRSAHREERRCRAARAAAVQAAAQLPTRPDAAPRLAGLGAPRRASRGQCRGATRLRSPACLGVKLTTPQRNLRRKPPKQRRGGGAAPPGGPCHAPQSRCRRAAAPARHPPPPPCRRSARPA